MAKRPMLVPLSEEEETLTPNKSENGQMPDLHPVQDKILNMKVRSPPSLFFLIFQGSVLFVSFAKTTSGL